LGKSYPEMANRKLTHKDVVVFFRNARIEKPADL